MRRRFAAVVGSTQRISLMGALTNHRCLQYPPGGFEVDLPSSLGWRCDKGNISTVNLRNKNIKRKRMQRNKKKLYAPPTLADIKKELVELKGKSQPVDRHESSRVGTPAESSAEFSEAEMLAAATTSGDVFPLEPPADGDAWERMETELERLHAVSPSTTVFGSELDRLEHDYMHTYHQMSGSLPPVDRAFLVRGGSKKAQNLRWEPSSSFDRLDPERAANSHYYAEAEALREDQQSAWYDYRRPLTQQQQQRDVDTGTADFHDDDDEVHAAEENPHFPLYDDAALVQEGATDAAGDEDLPQSIFSTTVRVDARRDYKPQLLVSAPGSGAAGAVDDDRLRYDAYRQRPAESGKAVVRGTDYWQVPEHRAAVETHEAYRERLLKEEQLAEGAMDSSQVEYSTNVVRKETLLYFQAHPINEMIQEHYVRIRQIYPLDGGAPIHFDAESLPEDHTSDVHAPESEALQRLHADVDVPVQEARRIARELGLDLIRIGSLYTQAADRRIIALCLIADHREHLREMLKFKIQKLGVQPPPTQRQIEVPFKGGTHPHAIRFKCVGIAKHLLHRHVIRINLTKFGTPREGFPVFQTILDEVKRQCLQLKAYHKAGIVQANYNEIFCYLYPSTGRSPKTSVQHPTAAEVNAARDFYTLANEKEVYFDDLRNIANPKERMQYLSQLANGTAWAHKDGGLSLQRQRRMKIMLGYLPKGNSEIYAARGDVNIPAPFRTSHPTGTERWTHPRESNLDQASRGAAVLGKRASMPVSEMHDRGETPENPSQLDRFFYRAQGPALEVGELKEALGLKDNRRKVPPLAPGFATLGTKEPSSSYDMGATK